MTDQVASFAFVTLWRLRNAPSKQCSTANTRRNTELRNCNNWRNKTTKQYIYMNDWISKHNIIYFTVLMILLHIIIKFISLVMFWATIIDKQVLLCSVNLEAILVVYSLVVFLTHDTFSVVEIFIYILASIYMLFEVVYSNKFVLQ